MKATILNIGDELLIGQVANTNATSIARLLTQAGISTCGVYTIADDLNDILLHLRHCLSLSQAVIITGGLGPTADDITKPALCRFFGTELYQDSQSLQDIQSLLSARGLPLTPTQRRQAMLLQGCTPLRNPLGTAPGMWFELPDKVVVALPGVPHEMLHLMQSQVIPRLLQRFGNSLIINRHILIQGIGEGALSDLIAPWEASLPKTLRLAYLPQAGLLRLRLTARGTSEQQTLLQQQLSQALRGLYSLAGQYIVGQDAEALPPIVASLFTQHHLSLATAESCTGGSLAAQLTALPGASLYFRGGVVAYSNHVKECALGVNPLTLKTFSAVSRQTVSEMALGAKQRFGSHFAVATTGVAGPSGGSPQCPVGSVWIGIAGPDGLLRTQLLHLGSGRQQIVQRAANTLWAELIRLVKSSYPL